MKSKSTIESLLFILSSHQRLNRECPEVIDIIENYINIEKMHIASAWNDGYWLGKNGFILENYSNGNEYYEKIYNAINGDSFKNQL
jgi:hypothetical protein